jgi:hypothetical protein
VEFGEAGQARMRFGNAVSDFKPRGRWQSVNRSVSRLGTGGQIQAALNGGGRRAFPAEPLGEMGTPSG